jgi:hypothetical protein
MKPPCGTICLILIGAPGQINVIGGLTGVITQGTIIVGTIGSIATGVATYVIGIGVIMCLDITLIYYIIVNILSFFINFFN